MTDLPNSLSARDVAGVLHPYTNLRKHEAEGPLVIVRGEGVRVYDEDGRDYIEGLAGLWCTALGWGEERLVEAATRQMRKLGFYHPFGHKSHEPMIALAERLLAMAPVPMSKAFFCNSGSEAVDSAIKLVWYYNNARGKPEKKKLIAREKAYHGVTVAAASLTGLPNNHRGFDLPLPNLVVRAACPHHWRYARDGESLDEFAQRLADELEQQIIAEGPDTVAAFFAEPVQGAGGVIVPPDSYFPAIQAVLEKYDVLLVADEVITGFGRTGNWWGSETFKMRPDIICMAKNLSSGYLPIAGVLVNDKVYQGLADNSAAIGTFGHGFTYGGHPVSAAVALEALEIYRERNVVVHARHMGSRLQQGLNRLERNHPLVGEARGIGMMGAVELVRDKATKEAYPAARGVGAMAVAKAQAHGVILRAMGDAVAFSPPLVILPEDLDEMLARFTRALDETHAQLRTEGL